MRKSAKYRRGFTLVEVVVATTVVGVGITGVMSMVIWMVGANSWSGHLSGASTLGHSALEEMLETSFVGLSNGSDTVGPYRRSWRIHTTPSGAYKTVHVEVEWERQGEKSSRVVLTSARSNPLVPGASLAPFNFRDGGGGQE